MKKTILKNIMVLLVPTVLFFGYRFLQFRLDVYFSFNIMPVWVMQYRVFLPMLIGVLLFYIGAYIYQNRNSLIFIWVFSGSFLFNLIYMIYTLSMNPAAVYSFVFRTSAPEVGYIAAGIYIVGFWVSLISYVKGRKKLKQEAKAAV